MNKVFTSLTLTAILSMGLTETMASELFIRINRGGQHSVLVNDQYQTNNNNTYRFFDLTAGSATVKVSDAGTGAAIFEGSINLGYNERVVAEMSADGNISIVTSFTVTYSNWYTQGGQGNNNGGNNNGGNNNGGGWGNNNGGNNNGGNNNGGWGNNNGGNNNGGNNNGGGWGNNNGGNNGGGNHGGHNHGGNNGPVCVSSEKFNEIVSAIKAQTVESYKLDKAKSIVKKNKLSSAQVAEVCKLFSVESYKLEFAKFAYDYTVDKDNYFVVGKTFEVASYSRDLDKYIDSKH